TRPERLAEKMMWNLGKNFILAKLRLGQARNGIQRSEYPQLQKSYHVRGPSCSHFIGFRIDASLNSELPSQCGKRISSSHVFLNVVAKRCLFFFSDADVTRL